MGKRGPKPKSAALKIASGTRKDRIQGESPARIPGAPSCPSHLDAVAKLEFRRMASLLKASHALSKADGPALALYSQTYSQWIKAEAEVAKKGILVETGLGAWKKNPAIDVATQAKALCLKLLVEFGFTRAARGRITDGPADSSSDSLDDFLKRG